VSINKNIYKNMSFWNNPENNSLKAIFLVVVLIGAGYFVFKNMESSSLGGEGKVININTPGTIINVTNPVPPMTGAFVPKQGDLAMSVKTMGQNCTITIKSLVNPSDRVEIAGAVQSNGDCKPNATQASPAAKTMAGLIGGPVSAQ
jgi:hypothetical protein